MTRRMHASTIQRSTSPIDRSFDAPPSAHVRGRRARARATPRMDTMSAVADALLDGPGASTGTSGKNPFFPIAPPPGVVKVRCERTGYVMTKPFEANNPMPEAFDQTCEYIVKMLNPVIKPKGQGVKKADGGDAGASGQGKKKEKKPTAPVEEVDPVEKAKLVVGKVVEVGHVENSDKLYLCQVDVGEEAPRQVVTGLRKFVPENELKDAMVLTIVNLKPAKLAGQASVAMILATEYEAEGETKVKLVRVPEGAKCGDVVTPAGTAPSATYPKECKSKFWDAVKEKLAVKDGKAMYGDKVLSCEAGECTVTDVPSGASIK